jgi:hypothetical protein
MPVFFIPIPMSVPTIVTSHLVDQFPDGILASSSGPQPAIQVYSAMPRGIMAGFRRGGRNRMATVTAESWPRQRARGIVLQVG